jgi:menaquinone-dependent protoporphyrinogen oxidase
MKTAIFYATTHGTTEKIVGIMQQTLGKQRTQLFNLKTSEPVNMTNFDRIIIGGSIHAGMIQKCVKDFCKNHTLELLQKPLGLFTCGMNDPEFETQFQKAFPEILRKHALAQQTLQGEFIIEKMNFFQRLIVRKVSGIHESISRIDPQKIAAFAEKMNQC